MRVVSLLPSATEMLAGVMAQSKNKSIQLVGRSHECDYPKHLIEQVPVLTSQKTMINPDSANPAKDIDQQVREALATSSSLYNIDQAGLVGLKPDVILTQSLCEVCSVDLVSVERIAHKHLKECKIVDLNPQTLGQVLDDFVRVGEAVGDAAAGERAKAALELRVAACLETVAAELPRPNVLLMEWTDPLFVGGHWTPEIIERAGGKHVLNHAGQKSICIAKPGEAEELKSGEVDIVLVALCGMNLVQTRRMMDIFLSDEQGSAWLRKLKAFQHKHVILVDGNDMFNRPGPRLVDCLEWCVELFAAWRSADRSATTTPRPRLLNANSKFPAEMLF